MGETVPGMGSRIAAVPSVAGGGGPLSPPPSLSGRRSRGGLSPKGAPGGPPPKPLPARNADPVPPQATEQPRLYAGRHLDHTVDLGLRQHFRVAMQRSQQLPV